MFGTVQDDMGMHDQFVNDEANQNFIEKINLKKIKTDAKNTVAGAASFGLTPSAVEAVNTAIDTALDAAVQHVGTAVVTKGSWLKIGKIITLPFKLAAWPIKKIFSMGQKETLRGSETFFEIGINDNGTFSFNPGDGFTVHLIILCVKGAVVAIIIYVTYKLSKAAMNAFTNYWYNRYYDPSQSMVNNNDTQQNKDKVKSSFE